MNNIDRIQEYIQDAVISPLERLMNGDSGKIAGTLINFLISLMSCMRHKRGG